MELGNIFFGHSRGEFPIPDRYQYLELLRPLLEKLNTNNYGVKFSNDVFEMNPYCWCDGEECPQCSLGTQANLLYKPTGFELRWYKYALRDTYTNQEVTPESFTTIINACIESLGELPERTPKVLPSVEMMEKITAKFLRNGRHGGKGDAT